MEEQESNEGKRTAAPNRAQGRKHPEGHNPIKRDMMLGDLAREYPKAAMLMAQKGMHCMGCGMAAMETIEQGARAHGMSDEDIDKLIDEMNKAVASADKK